MASTMPLASSAASVVCMRKATLPGSAGCSRADIGHAFHQRHRGRRLAHRAFHFLVPGVADQRDQVAVGGKPAGFGVHLRHERAGRVHGLETAPGRFRPHSGETPWAENTTFAPSGHLARARRRRPPRPAPGPRPRWRCARSACARRPGRRAAPAPARRSRSRARRRRRTTAGCRAAPAAGRPRRPSAPAPGAACRSDRSAAMPPVTTRGLSTEWPGVSEIARTTAAGPPAAPASSGADSMSTAIAPVAARPACSPGRTRWSTVTIGPVLTRRPARRSSPASSGADAHSITVVAVGHLEWRRPRHRA